MKTLIGESSRCAIVDRFARREAGREGVGRKWKVWENMTAGGASVRIGWLKCMIFGAFDNRT